MQHLARALAYFSGASFVGTATQIIKGKLSAVLLGTTGVGVISQLTYAWSLINTTAGLGFYNGLIRRIADCHSRGDTEGMVRQLSSVLLFLTVFSVALAGLAALFAPLVSDFLFHDAGARGDLVALILIAVPFAIVANTYRGLMSGVRKVKALIAGQIAADFASLVVFVILIFTLNLLGAVLAYVALHVLKSGFNIWFAGRALGVSVILPRPQEFHWTEVRHNVGYGVSGLIMVSLGIVTVIFVSRWIIAQEGLAANGIFSVAWKVATVYLGALYSSAGGYYFPTLAGAPDEQSLYREMNDAVALYMYLVPPLMVGLMASGEILVRLLFSIDFTFAAVLLLLLLPADLLRIVGETVGLSLLARRNLVSYAGIYVAWATLYLSLVWWLLPLYGLMGVVLAYLLSQAANAAMNIIAAGVILGFGFDRYCLLAMLRAVVLVVLASWLTYRFGQTWIGYLSGVCLVATWLGLSLLDVKFRNLACHLLRKVL